MPAFLARPAGAPVYHGFPVIGDVEVDGFRLGMITNFLSGPAREGDAYVIAPDGRPAARAGAGAGVAAAGGVATLVAAMTLLAMSSAAPSTIPTR